MVPFRKGADGVVARESCIAMRFERFACERPPRLREIRWLRDFFIDRAATPPHEASLHPYLGALDTGGGRRCGTKSLYISVMPARRSKPRQRVFVPGCPSPLRPRCPPRAPTIRIATPRTGGC